MATIDVESESMRQIGETAGSIWRALADDGPLSLAKLLKKVDAPRDLVLQGMGWLAREDKLLVEETPRGRILSLR